MWQIISNISAIFTCIMFIAYIIGHIWTIYIQKEAIFEKIDFENFDNEVVDIDYIDFTNNSESGQIFSISSPLGIRRISIYSVERDENSKLEFKRGKLLKSIKNISQNKKAYFKTELFDCSPSLYIEIQRADYIITSYAITDSGRDGSLVQLDYKSKMTLKSWLYYLCS